MNVNQRCVMMHYYVSFINFYLNVEPKSKVSLPRRWLFVFTPLPISELSNKSTMMWLISLLLLALHYQPPPFVFWALESQSVINQLRLFFISVVAQIENKINWCPWGLWFGLLQTDQKSSLSLMSQLFSQKCESGHYREHII